MTTKPRRRWFQFGVLSLLIVTTIVAVLIAWFVVPAQRQRNAVANLEEMGAQIFEQSQRASTVGGASPVQRSGPKWLRKLIGDDYFRRVDVVMLDSRRYQEPAEIDAALRNLEQLPWLDMLAIHSGYGLNDDHLGQIARLWRLKGLNLHGGGRIGDPGVSHLAALTQLTGLSLTGAFGSAGLKDIGRLKNLTRLHLSGAFTDEGLAYLVGLAQLHELILDGPISDEGLVYVAKLPQLRTLILRGAVTDAGMAHLEPLTQLKELRCNTSRVNDALGWNMAVDFDQAALASGLEYIGNFCSITFRFDDKSLGDRAKKLRSLPITEVVNNTPMRDVLERILAPAGLGYRIETQEIVITTREAAEEAHVGIKLLQCALPKLRTVEVGW